MFHVARGSKLLIHAQRTDYFDDLRAAVGQGAPFPLTKMTQEFTSLRDVKRDSPQTWTMARGVAPHDGMGGVEDATDEEVDLWSDWVLAPLYTFAAANPDFLDYIDIWELINEADPPNLRGYLMLGKIMRRCAQRLAEEFPGLWVGVGSFNMGTPEYEEMQAFVNSGVFDEPNVVLCLHEGVQGPDDPINKWHSSEPPPEDDPDAPVGIIPGAPSVPPHGGALFGRVAYWHQILGDERMPYVVVTEAYLHSYDDHEEMARRVAWVDDLYSKLWYVVGFAPFTHSPTGRWDNQNYSPAYPRLLQHMLAVKDRENAAAPGSEPDPEPEPEPLHQWAWRRSEETAQPQPTFGLHKALEGAGFKPYGDEFRDTNDEQRYSLQTGFDADWQRAVALAPVPWTGQVEVVTEKPELPDDPDPDPQPDPDPFAWRAWPTEYKTITQVVGNNPGYYGRISPHFEGHEGPDIRAPMRSPVFSVDAGVVSDLRQAGDAAHPYGRFVRIASAGGYETTYAHLDSIAVALGQHVTAGQKIGEADNTGNIVQGSSHLHVTQKKDGVIIDPTPFIMPHRPDYPGLPPSAHGLTLCDVSRHNNPNVNGTITGPIDFHKMARRGAVGCYIRGPMGKTGADPAFALNWSAIAETPMLRGIYHLWIAQGLSAEDNLGNIVRWVNQHGHGDLRIAIDIEPISGARINGDEVSRFLDLFKSEFGYEPVKYTGLWVLGYVDGDRSWVLRPNLWLAAYWNVIPQIGQFPALPAGASLNNLMGHQWTSSRYDGRLWGLASIGLDINVIYDLDSLIVTDVEPPEPPPPPPPPSLSIDMAQYFLPRSGDYGDIVILKNNWGQGDERQQLQRQGNLSFVTKNAQYELREIGEDVIRLDVDTSPGQGNYYVVESSTGWMPRHWRPNATFTRHETARFFRKSDCKPTGQVLGPGSSDLRFAKLHARFTTRGGITFEDVAEVHWIRKGQVEERYWYAKGYGLIAWANRGGRESWAVEVIPLGQQHNNRKENIPCL